MPHDNAPQQTIPVFSLRDFTDGTTAERAAFIQGVGDALVDIGFFALTDHGVDTAMVQRSYAAAEAFFRQPLDVRLQYEVAQLHGQRGYTSFGREHAKDSAAPDLKEFWHVGRERDSDPRSAAITYDNIWPAEVPEYKTSMQALFAALDQCAQHLLTACSIYMDEAPDFLPNCAEYGDTVLRIIHYPPVPDDRHPASVRAAAHEDINLITLLPEATAGGLELLQRDGSWRPIHALGGQIVVDAGDMLQQLTNGLFKSTTHRVVNPDDSRDRRFSMPFFVHPRAEVDLSPLPGSVQKTGGTVRYPNITAGEYLAQRLREIGLTK
jgi:isopenicillin N synthase-like dioxygenase